MEFDFRFHIASSLASIPQSRGNFVSDILSRIPDPKAYAQFSIMLGVAGQDMKDALTPSLLAKLRERYPAKLSMLAVEDFEDLTDKDMEDLRSYYGFSHTEIIELAYLSKVDYVSSYFADNPAYELELDSIFAFGRLKHAVRTIPTILGHVRHLSRAITRTLTCGRLDLFELIIAKLEVEQFKRCVIGIYEKTANVEPYVEAILRRYGQDLGVVLGGF